MNSIGKIIISMLSVLFCSVLAKTDPTLHIKNDTDKKIEVFINQTPDFTESRAKFTILGREYFYSSDLDIPGIGLIQIDYTSSDKSTRRVVFAIDQEPYGKKLPFSKMYLRFSVAKDKKGNDIPKLEPQTGKWFFGKTTNSKGYDMKGNIQPKNIIA